MAAAIAYVLVLVSTISAPRAQQPGGVVTTPTTVPGFLFELEFPLASMKQLATWPEIESLLDNPYQSVACPPGVVGNLVGYPAACAPRHRTSLGVTLPPLVIHPLNYNAANAQEMRLLNPAYPGGTWQVPDQLVQDPNDPNRWNWTYRSVDVSPGAGRVLETEIDYNGAITPETVTCIATTETIPPEGSILCGADTGEPPDYSVPGYVNGQLVDPFRGPIVPRDPVTGVGGLDKPTVGKIRVGANWRPNYAVNTDPNDVTASNENDYVKNRQMAAVLGKAIFWDMQLGSDSVQACGSCHAKAGADDRTKNQLNPNHLGGDLTFQLHQPNEELAQGDFPFRKLANPNVAGDPACANPLVAHVNAGVLQNTPSAVTGATVNADGSITMTVCNAANMVSDVNEVASSMGVFFRQFVDVANGATAYTPGSTVGGVQSVRPDITNTVPDPIPGFQDIRRVEPRNTPTFFGSAGNFDNFWDGRARHDYNGGSVFGASDPQAHVFVTSVNNPNSNNPQGQGLTATRQIIRFASLASLSQGPALSEFEMSAIGRNWAKIGRKLIQGYRSAPGGVTVVPAAGEVVPLANQLVDPTDSVLGPWSNQGGSSCPAGSATAAGKPGLCVSYRQLIQAAYEPELWAANNIHLNGAPCADPFDGYCLTIAPGQGTLNATGQLTDTNQFTQMEANFSLFYGLGLNVWTQMLIPDDTPYDRFMDANPMIERGVGEANEPGLVADIPLCSANGGVQPCLTEIGNFRRDLPAGSPDPLLGLDLFQGSNLSLRNPNFRTARCAECHQGAELTDHTTVVTDKIMLPDFGPEFVTPGVEAALEPIGPSRMISGFLLESEINENGQDGVERRIADQSIVPNPADGLAYPGGARNPLGPDGIAGTADDYFGADASFFDNGMYNLGIRPCPADAAGNLTGYCDDVGRGGNDPFGWPLSLAVLMLKNLGGVGQEPGTPLPTFDPDLGTTGGLFEETGHDQQINPGFEGDAANPLLPLYLAPWLNNVNVGDAHPELDEVFGGLNTLTDTPMLEGFIDVLGPFDPAGTLNESYNNGDSWLMGTWPVVNRVGRMGSFKAAPLRNVELTGPYFHTGSFLTLRQVVDFYVRGGDFPITNAQNRDFNLMNLNVEVQSNFTEAEKTAIVDFLLELTDDRVRYERAPFDRPEMFLPLDGHAPMNTFGRDGFLTGLTGVCAVDAAGRPTDGSTGTVIPGATGPCYQLVPAVGAAGHVAPVPTFLNVTTNRTPAPGECSHYSQVCGG